MNIDAITLLEIANVITNIALVVHIFFGGH